jgi:hypothetical protein
LYCVLGRLQFLLLDEVVIPSQTLDVAVVSSMGLHLVEARAISYHHLVFVKLLLSHSVLAAVDEGNMALIDHSLIGAAMRSLLRASPNLLVLSITKTHRVAADVLLSLLLLEVKHTLGL